MQPCGAVSDGAAATAAAAAPTPTAVIRDRTAGLRVDVKYCSGVFGEGDGGAATERSHIHRLVGTQLGIVLCVYTYVRRRRGG